jgi:hypothetical protein
MAENYVILAKFCCHSVPLPGIGNFLCVDYSLHGGRPRPGGVTVQEIDFVCPKVQRTPLWSNPLLRDE